MWSLGGAVTLNAFDGSSKVLEQLLYPLAGAPVGIRVRVTRRGAPPARRRLLSPLGACEERGGGAGNNVLDDGVDPQFLHR